MGRMIQLRGLNGGIPAEYGSKRWIENQLIVAINMGLVGRPASDKPNNPQPMLPRNPALAVTALMHLARLKGFVIEKRQQATLRADLSKMSPVDLKATLEGTLDALSPGERQRILEIADGTEAEEIPDAEE